MKSKLLFLMIGIILLIGIGSVSAFNWSDGTLVSYWKLDDESGNAIDEQGNHNLFANDVLYNQTGATINTGTSFNFSIGVSYLANSSTIIGMGKNLSGTMWVRADAYTDLNTILELNGLNSYICQLRITPAYGIIFYAYDGSTYTSTANYIPYMNKWTFIYWEVTSKTMKLYINNNLIMNNASTWKGFNDGSALKNLTIGNDGTGSRDFQGGIDEVGIWNRTLTESEITELYNDGNGLIYGESGVPAISVNLTSPVNNLIISTSNQTFISNLTMSKINYSYSWVNNTYNIWYSNGTQFNKTIVTGLSTNSTIVNKTFNLNLGNYIWNSYACYGNLTYSNCSWGSYGNYTFSVNSSINSETHNALGYETGTEVYTLNISSPYTPYSAYLVYNGTSYSATVTSSGGNYLLSKTLKINSTMIGLNSFYYKWNLSSTFAENSSVYNQTIEPIQFGLCNGTLTIPYMNFTFKDEGSLTFIKASIPSSTFIYYLGDGTINKTYLYTNTTANLNYTFCALPSSQTYYIKTNIQYKNDTSYPQRIFDDSTKAFTNLTTNKTLYLLDSAQGIYVTYQVLDAIGNQLNGVQVNVNRTIEGLPYNVGNGQTDSAGSITFWLNPDFIHSLSFTKSGYETFSLAQFPTQSAYTITLGTSTGLGINDYIRGITYTILPYYGTILNVSKLYNFNMTFNSSYWTLDSFGFILYGDGTVIGGNYSTSSSGGYLENVLNVSSYTHVSIKIYWIINGTTTYGINNGWYTYDYEEGTEWSIFNFFKDLKKYAGEGIFGLNQNSLNLIIFVIIFLTTGLVSYKFSLSSPTVVTGMIFGLVFLFDVGLGLISVPLGAVQHFPTIFMLLITVALSIWEMRR